MTIARIEIYSATGDMGDNVTADAADGYRVWLAAQVQKEFPLAAVAVFDKQATSCIWCDAGPDDWEEYERLQQFASDVWDRCPWDWVS